MVRWSAGPHLRLGAHGRALAPQGTAPHGHVQPPRGVHGDLPPPAGDRQGGESGVQEAAGALALRVLRVLRAHWPRSLLHHQSHAPGPRLPPAQGRESLRGHGGPLDQLFCQGRARGAAVDVRGRHRPVGHTFHPPHARSGGAHLLQLAHVSSVELGGRGQLHKGSLGRDGGAQALRPRHLRGSLRPAPGQVPVGSEPLPRAVHPGSAQAPAQPRARHPLRGRSAPVVPVVRPGAVPRHGQRRGALPQG
mmetsp:Transcript_12651/g.37174  ORF Transcript_12651/g.37174 Transcript_12651/m.37174 type:complete len:249 (+) Transcript_12651:801-1547(+)